MSLDKAIEHGKEHRKPYRRPKDVDGSCRNHGTCPSCQGARQHKHVKRELSAREQLTGDSHEDPDPWMFCGPLPDEYK